jgi:hypothetical protein
VFLPLVRKRPKPLPVLRGPVLKITLKLFFGGMGIAKSKIDFLRNQTKSGSIFSEKEATDYCQFVEKILEKVKDQTF